MGAATAKCCDSAKSAADEAPDDAKMIDPRKEDAAVTGPSPGLPPFKEPSTQAKTEEVSTKGAPFKFAFKLERGDTSAPLGVGLNSVARNGGMMHLYVQSIKAGGFVETWNQENPSLKLLAGDLITKVNEIEGKPGEMVTELKSSSSCELHVERYPA